MQGDSLIAPLLPFLPPSFVSQFEAGGLLNDQVFILEIALLIFLIFLPLFLSTWVYWRNEVFKEALKWVLLEIKVPREVDKSPRAMERVLAAIHALRNSAEDFQEIYWDGEVTRWTSFEVVSFGGEVHMYLRLYYKQRGLIEAAFYSFYKDVELVEVDDYMDVHVPAHVDDIYRQGYDLWGGEMKLMKENAYPIRSYLEFEAVDEEHQIDPISNLVEMLAKLKKEEFMGLQVLIAPVAPNWHKHWKHLVEKLRQAEPPKKATGGTAVEFPGGPLPVFSPTKPSQDQFGSLTKAFLRTPGETDVLKAIEHNLSKSAFRTTMRFMYLSPKSMLYDSYPRRGLLAAFNQYSSLDLNSFNINYRVSTRTKVWNFPYIFPKIRNEYKKQRVLADYRTRNLPPETFMGKVITSSFFDWNVKSTEMILTTESLATVFHPPSKIVLTAPHMVRVESRKTGPPAGVAIYGEGESIEKMM